MMEVARRLVSEMSWQHALELAGLIFAGSALAPWRALAHPSPWRTLNRRRRGVLGAPSPLCTRGLTEAPGRFE